MHAFDGKGEKGVAPTMLAMARQRRIWTPNQSFLTNVDSRLLSATGSTNRLSGEQFCEFDQVAEWVGKESELAADGR